MRSDTIHKTWCRRARPGGVRPLIPLAVLASLAGLVGCSSPPPARRAPMAGESWAADPGLGFAGGANASADPTANSALQGPDGASAAGGVGGGAPAGGAPASGAGDEPEDGLAVHGSLTTRYLLRQSGGDQDHDIYGLLSLDIGDKAQDAWTGHVVGRVSKDLDGDTGGDDSPFFSLDDADGHSLDARLYEAYVDGHDAGLAVYRIGRQSLIETPEYVRIDGIRLESEPEGSDKHVFGGYAGLPVHEYESSERGDQALGVYAANRPWDGARARIDYMHLEDEVQLGTENNDLWSVRLDQAVDRQVLLHGEYQLLENEPREYTVRGTWTDTEDGTVVQASHHELLSTQRVLVEELDPFYETLIEYAPFREERLFASTPIDEDFDLSGGVDARRVKDQSDVGEFNRDFDRYHATGTWHDLFTEDLSLSLTGETWNANGSDETTTWGLDLTKVVSEEMRVSAGSYYALFKNDFLLGEERVDVRTYYVSLRLRQDPSLSWMFGYEYEDGEDDDFQSLTARATWRF